MRERRVLAPKMPTAGGTDSCSDPAQSCHSAQPAVGPTATQLHARAAQAYLERCHDASAEAALLAEGEPSTPDVPATRPSPSASRIWKASCGACSWKLPRTSENAASISLDYHAKKRHPGREGLIGYVSGKPA